MSINVSQNTTSNVNFFSIKQPAGQQQQTAADSGSASHSLGELSQSKPLLALLSVLLKTANDNTSVLQSGKTAIQQIEAILTDCQLDSGHNPLYLQTVHTALAEIASAYAVAKPVDTEGLPAIAAKQHKLQQTVTKKLTRVADAIGNGNLHSKNAVDSLLTKINMVKQQANNSSTQFPACFAGIQQSGGSASNDDYAALWHQTAESIKNIKSNYLDFYAHLTQKYTEMYQKYNKTVQQAAGEAVSAGKDGNYIKFDADKMRVTNKKSGALDQFNEWCNGPGSPGSVTDWSTMSPEQKQQMTEILAPAFKVDQSNGKISYDMDQYKSCPDFPGNGDVSTAKYQAWLASFNAVGSNFQSNMQSFLQRYTHANNTYDNLVKVLSATINTLCESAKEVLKALS